MTQQYRLARSVGGRGGHEGPEVKSGPSPTSASHPYAIRNTEATPRQGLWTLPQVWTHKRPQPVSFLLITPLKNPEAVPTLRHASRLLHFRVTVNTMALVDDALRISLGLTEF